LKPAAGGMNNFMFLNSGRIRVEFISRSLPARGGADWETKENEIMALLRKMISGPVITEK
jgi:hypothetical protein